VAGTAAANNQGTAGFWAADISVRFNLSSVSVTTGLDV
jgi:hypothetical protein